LLGSKLAALRAGTRLANNATPTDTADTPTNRKAEVEAMRAAAKELDAMIATWGASEDELMGDRSSAPAVGADSMPRG
jgi:hypothetical protein